MPTLTLLPVGQRQYLDANGHPLANGRVHFWEPGGEVTRLSVYTDANGSVEHPNPVELDASGRATIYLLARAYREVVKDSNGVTISTTDPVQALQPTASVNQEIDGTAGEDVAAGQIVYLSSGSGGLTAGRWYKADADFDYASLLPVLGFVVSDIDAGASGLIRRGGIVDGLSGLVAGTTYYVSATAATLTATKPTNARAVGVAINSTTLIIQFDPPRYAEHEPVGCFKPYGGSSAPVGWLLCDGSAVSRTTYAALFAVVGTSFGAGDGSTTFNVPDMRRRTVVGAGGSGTATLANTVGSTGGAETHTLLTAEMPSHTHVQDAHTHTQDAHGHGSSTVPFTGNSSTPNGGGGAVVHSGGTTAVTVSSTTAVNQNTTAVNQNTGGDGAHNNMQPSLVANYIVKT